VISGGMTAMPTVGASDPTRPCLQAPLCPVCGKGMRLESSEPSTPYINLDEFKYVCDCGRTASKIVANAN